ncbi:MAG: pallilysin-related adhesin [Treponema sp.]|nr:pallilysin-related adhesin [Treponema sp.]
MKRFTTISFALTAVSIIIFAAYTYKNPKEPEYNTIRAKVVKPNVQQTIPETKEIIAEETETELQSSLIELQSWEALLSALSIDMNNDAFDDQIISIRKSGSPSIHLVTGIYNPKTKIYERKSEIDTKITRPSTFSFSVLDMTGDHINALTFTGLNEKAETVLSVYLPDTKEKKFKYNKIADFTADATIFIQQLQRSDPYSFSQTQGESFPIWVYSSDSSKSGDSLDQIQTMYDWDRTEEKYVKVSETRVAGKKIAAAELQKIQDGTEETFENFLDGLWYKTSADDSNLRCIYFNAAKREIVFSADTIQEIYRWNTTSLRKNSANLTMINTYVTNLIRRFDVTLNDIDEIKVKVNDDVKMPITQETLWDGTYKKINMQSLSSQQQDFDLEILKRIETTSHIWTTNTNMSVTIKNGQYTATNELWTTRGALTSLRIKGTTLLQFKSFGEEKFLDGYYLPSFVTTKNGSETKETLTLAPVTISIDGYTSTTSKAIKLERIQPPTS